MLFTGTDGGTMDISVTSTQRGMTSAQLDTAWFLLSRVHAVKLHHGDCVGGDEEFHQMALAQREVRKSCGLPYMAITIHPPSNPEKRAFCEGYDEVRKAFPYLVRNHHIVDESDLLIAAPRTANEELRSGTWATARYAWKLGKPVIIINPDGSWRLDNKGGK
jgi:hypothetical protein